MRPSRRALRRAVVDEHGHAILDGGTRDLPVLLGHALVRLTLELNRRAA